MKLAKLSLAAIMAAGAFSYANAGSLEDAIKGVEVSGFARYRYYDETADNSERHRFSGAFSLVTPVADNLKFKITLEAEDNEYAANTADGSRYSVTFSDFYFNYVTPEVNVVAGKQAINTPLTDPGYRGTRGTGAVALYTGIKGVTLAAAGFVNSNLGGFGEENIYALAAIGAFGPVKAQLWGFKVTNVLDSAVFAEVSGKVAGFCAKAQYVVTNPTAAGADNGAFYGVKAGYSMDGFSVAAGYTATDNDNGLSTLSADGSLIKAGKQLYYWTTNQADADFAFLTASASFGKFGANAGYIDASVGNVDGNEYYIGASYAYSKKFGMNIYYSDMDVDGTALDNKEVRFEAKYKF